MDYSILEKLNSNIVSASNLNKDYNSIYKIHKYWARKPWYVINKYIKKYSNIGDTVLDPFCGSGATGLEALFEGRKFIGNDLNPSSIHIANATCNINVSVNDLLKEFDLLKNNIKKQIIDIYMSSTICPVCGSKLIYKHYYKGPKFNERTMGYAYCPKCSFKDKYHEMSIEDIENEKKYNNIKIDHWIPKNSFPQKFYKDRFSYKGISLVTDMFSHRNTFALSLILNEIEKIKNQDVKDMFMLAFTNTLLHVSKLKGENVRPLSVNNYWIPDDYIEENVWDRFENRFNLIIKGKREQKKRLENSLVIYSKESYDIKTKSALEPMGTECVDYVFTDPPYGEAIQYSELSFLWNSWLNKEYKNEDEIIVNPVQGKKDIDFLDMLCKSIDNIYNALKPNAYFTLCFQNKDYSIWERLVIYCKNLGLSLEDISVYDTFGSPFNKNWASFSPKADLYVTFCKSNSNKNNYFSLELNYYSVLSTVLEYSKNKKFDDDYIKLYDLTVSYLIWNMYYNNSYSHISNFDTKKFVLDMNKLSCESYNKIPLQFV